MLWSYDNVARLEVAKIMVAVRSVQSGRPCGLVCDRASGKGMWSSRGVVTDGNATWLTKRERRVYLLPESRPHIY